MYTAACGGVMMIPTLTPAASLSHILYLFPRLYCLHPPPSLPRSHTQPMCTYSASSHNKLTVILVCVCVHAASGVCDDPQWQSWPGPSGGH